MVDPAPFSLECDEGKSMYFENEVLSVVENEELDENVDNSSGGRAIIGVTPQDARGMTFKDLLSQAQLNNEEVEELDKVLAELHESYFAVIKEVPLSNVVEACGIMYKAKAKTSSQVGEAE